jgi:hypothetical protein
MLLITPTNHPQQPPGWAWERSPRQHERLGARVNADDDLESVEESSKNKVSNSNLRSHEIPSRRWPDQSARCEMLFLPVPLVVSSVNSWPYGEGHSAAQAARSVFITATNSLRLPS